MSTTYNLRKSPTLSEKGQSLSEFMPFSPRFLSTNRKRKLTRAEKEDEEFEKRVTGFYDDFHPNSQMVRVANELVMGVRPPDWFTTGHQAEFFKEWEEVQGRHLESFEQENDYISWLGYEVKAPKIDEQFAMVDMSEPIQGRSMTAKRLDGKELSPWVKPSPDEMDWREWRRFSRAANLLLEAVDGVPWGWDMDDEEWERFSKADQRCNKDLTKSKSALRWRYMRWWDEIYMQKKREQEKREREERERLERECQLLGICSEGQNGLEHVCGLEYLEAPTGDQLV